MLPNAECQSRTNGVDVHEISHCPTIIAAITAISNATARSVNPKMVLIHRGANTQTQDQVILPNNFAITKMMVRILATGNPALTVCISLIVLLKDRVPCSGNICRLKINLVSYDNIRLANLGANSVNSGCWNYTHCIERRLVKQLSHVQRVDVYDCAIALRIMYYLPCVCEKIILFKTVCHSPPKLTRLYDLAVAHSRI